MLCLYIHELMHGKNWACESLDVVGGVRGFHYIFHSE